MRPREIPRNERVKRAMIWHLENQIIANRRMYQEWCDKRHPPSERMKRLRMNLAKQINE